jgi:hypothetical protein
LASFAFARRGLPLTGLFGIFLLLGHASDPFCSGIGQVAQMEVLS